MRVALLDDYQNAALRCADWSGLDVTAFNDHIADDDVLVARLEPFDVARGDARADAVHGRAAGAAAEPAAAGHHRRGQRVDRRRRRATLTASRCAGPASLSSPTAELTWGLILALARNIPAEDAAVRAGGWQHTVGADLRAAARSACSASGGSARASPRWRARSGWT